ncbi:DUF488 domain-containing protein [Neptunomonas sp.]|uniref:DUF488 domain-containing protein n=1 Tax=Neptunomonas sp. TaxID=1971898 RepID=UPI0025F30B62|nr:DUF488 domain-containing protein [Neptunomonas sp.]
MAEKLRKNMGTIFTIGYEGTTISDFLDTLRSNHIDVLLDVREFPISRKKGFSKNQLRSHLEVVGIEYKHEKSLGSPKPVRTRLYESKNYKNFFTEFDLYLSDQNEILERVTSEVSGNVALMCFEKDVMTCHRKSVARELSKLTSSAVRHLKVN